MAIGIRILSDNLSGLTADVTFLPTTGGTIDLGSQTIPFNYISNDPYGVYELYIPTYDYTYELEAKASVFSGQSFAFSSRLTTNFNNGSVTLNYNDFTAEIIDLGVDYAGWNLIDLYPLQDYGYGYYFEQDNDNCWRWVVFTDVYGNIIDQYQAFTDCNDDWDDLGGKWLTFLDDENGVFKYFNGENVYTYNFDPSNHSLSVETGWDGVMSNNNFVVSIRNFSANTRTNHIVNSGTLTQFGSPYDTGDFYDNIDTYFSGDFIVRTFFDDSNGSIIYVEFYNGTTGELLDNVTFPGNTFDNYNISFYGDNKVFIVFNSNNDYKIVHFNGNTSTMKTLDHDRNNYPNNDQYSNSNFYPNDSGSESFLIQLFYEDNNDSLGRIVTYCDLIYMLSGDTDFNTHTFQNSGSPDKTIGYGTTSNNSVYIPCDNGDGFVSTLCITPSGVTYINSDVISPVNVNRYNVGNNYVSLIFSDGNNTGCTLNYISEDAVLLDSISGITFTGGSYQYRTESVGNVFWFTNYGDTNVFINTTSTQFQESYPMDSLDLGYTPGGQFKLDFIRTGTILILNESTKVSSIITSDNFITGTTLPQSYNSNYNIEVGEDKFQYVYEDIDGFTNIELYDFDFNLLNSEITPYTSWWDTDSCGNRFYTIIEDNSQYIIYLVSESNITSKTLTDDNNYYTFNDYINWD
jgi:hypothetical protein